MTSSCEVDMCTVDLFWGTRKSFNGFESQQAVFVSQTSSERGEEKTEEKLDRPQSCFWVLPVLAWCFHRGGFHSLWQRPVHYHLCPALWWERCLFQFGLGPLKEKEREKRVPVRVRAFSKLSLKYFNSALTSPWCTWPIYGILIFLMCFN